jgi:glycosyltransferase involved in cell wall biosynthesis
MTILHLTHTDILHDSRILKEMQTIVKFNTTYSVHGIGVVLNEGSTATKDSVGISVHTIILKSRNWRFLPNIVRHVLTLLELTFKMFFQALSLKPDLIHCHDTLVLPLGVILKIFTQSKLLYDAHELESNRNGLSKTLGKMTLLTEKFLWRFVDRLIVVSPSIQEWYKKNIGEKYSEVILNAPVFENINDVSDKRYLRDKFIIPDTTKIFIYIGILGKGRGIEIFLEVFKSKEINAHLVFCGYGELKESLDKISQKFQNIHVHNAVSHEKVVSVAKSADIGLCFIENVSLSDYYCLPNKLFEYAFAEIPILASNFPDITAIVEKYNLGKCSDVSFQSIHKAINEFEDMKELPKINGKDLYELSWSYQEEKLINFYKDLIIEIKEDNK